MAQAEGGDVTASAPTPIDAVASATVTAGRALPAEKEGVIYLNGTVRLSPGANVTLRSRLSDNASQVESPDSCHTIVHGIAACGGWGLPLAITAAREPEDQEAERYRK